jgi:hypothetical protein
MSSSSPPPFGRCCMSTGAPAQAPHPQGRSRGRHARRGAGEGAAPVIDSCIGQQSNVVARCPHLLYCWVIYAAGHRERLCAVPVSALLKNYTANRVPSSGPPAFLQVQTGLSPVPVVWPGALTQRSVRCVNVSGRELRRALNGEGGYPPSP